MKIANNKLHFFLKNNNSSRFIVKINNKNRQVYIDCICSIFLTGIATFLYVNIFCLLLFILQIKNNFNENKKSDFFLKAYLIFRFNSESCILFMLAWDLV